LRGASGGGTVFLPAVFAQDALEGVTNTSLERIVGKHRDLQGKALDDGEAVDLLHQFLVKHVRGRVCHLVDSLPRDFVYASFEYIEPAGALRVCQEFPPQLVEFSRFLELCDELSRVGDGHKSRNKG